MTFTTLWLPCSWEPGCYYDFRTPGSCVYGALHWHGSQSRWTLMPCTQCYWNWLWIHCDPVQDKVVNEGEWWNIKDFVFFKSLNNFVQFIESDFLNNPSLSVTCLWLDLINTLSLLLEHMSSTILINHTRFLTAIFTFVLVGVPYCPR